MPKAFKKELRQPDEFQTFWARVAELAAARRKQVTAGAVALVVAVAGIMGMASWREHRAIGATQAFERIQKIAMAELVPAEGAPPRFDDGVPHFKTSRERAEAAAREADAFLAAEAGSPLRDKALLLKAGFLADAGKPDAAIAVHNEMLGGSLDRRLRFLALEGMALAYEAKNELDKADGAYGRLAEEGVAEGGFYRDRALFARGRIAERKGNPKEAEKLYREVLDKMPTSTMRDQISDRLAAIEAK